MLGGTLALFNRGLRVDCRRWSSHLMRCLLVLVILFFLVTTAMTNLVQLTVSPGLEFFRMISYANFAFITLAGISYFTTGITEEKEEQTLGLLKMAGLNPLGILLGKSAPRLVNALLLLGVQFPFVQLAITLGGILPHQVRATYVALAGYIVLLASLGLCCSVISRNSRRAVGTMSLLLALPLVAQWITWIIAIPGGGTVFATVRQRLEWVSCLTVAVRLGEIMRIGFNESSISPQFLAHLISAAAVFLLAWLSFNRCTRIAHTDTPGRSVFLRRSTRRSFGSVGITWSNALAWKDFHFVTGGIPGLMIRTVFYTLVTAAIGGVMFWTSGELPLPTCVWTLLTICFFCGVFESAASTSRGLRTEIQWRTLPSLVMLPRSIESIIRSKMLGSLPSLVPVAMFFLLGCVLAAGSFLEVIEDALRSPSPLAWTMWSMSILLVLLLCLIFVQLSSYFSLIFRWGYVALAFVVIIISSWMFCTMGSFVMMLITLSQSAPIAASWVPLLAMSFIAALLISINVGLHYAIIAQTRIAAAR